MGKTQKKNINLEEIMKFAQLLTAKQQENFAKEIKRAYVTDLARKLDKSALENDITMDEIVAECRAARKELAEEKKGANKNGKNYCCFGYQYLDILFHKK